jgi:hypothetical protein
MAGIPPEVRTLLEQADAKDVRFIKLGRQSRWWPLAKSTSSLRLGFAQFDFALCQAGEWDMAKKAFEATGARKRAGDFTRAVNQVRDFFELPRSVLWFTIEDGDVWWCFAEPGVTDLRHDGDEAETGAQMRRVVDRWRNTDINGEPLVAATMTTKITKVTAFQETIARPGGAVDLLRKIRADHSESHNSVKRAHDEVVQAVGDLLDQLHQDDFELLIELIFSSSGWKRVSAVGGTQKTFDLALTLPTTGESCFVQVKTQTSPSVFKGLVQDLDNMPGYKRLFFAYHTPARAFENLASDRVTVWNRYEVARQAVRAGLVEWILLHTT